MRLAIIGFAAALIFCDSCNVAVLSQGTDNVQLIEPPKMETYFSPTTPITPLIISFLARAQKSVRVSIYGFTSPSITDELITLAHKGVDVKICFDRTQAAGKAEKLEIKKLKAAGVPYVIGTSIHGALNHEKMCIVDERIVEDGSWNWSASANLQNNYVNIVDDPERAKLFLLNWQSNWDYMQTENQPQ
jgi:phosphatidylserine/phosphatidylglycerophosphate/cardiolipin synthase-like enzyme